jgi:hypothetical protein
VTQKDRTMLARQLRRQDRFCVDGLSLEKSHEKGHEAICQQTDD